MNRKHLSLAMAVLLAAGGLWFARSAWRTHAVQQSNTGTRLQSTSERPQPGQSVSKPGRLTPPDPFKRFADFTPEQRVQFARKGRGPGG